MFVIDYFIRGQFTFLAKVNIRVKFFSVCMQSSFDGKQYVCKTLLLGCAARMIIFKRKNLNYLTVCFTQCTLFFQKVCFLAQICLPCVICWSYAEDRGMLRDIFFGL